MAVDPSSAPHCETYVELQNETCAGCVALERELDRLREQARIDIDNLQTDLIVQRRIIAKQKREIAEMRDAETPPSEVEQLLTTWRDLTGRTKRTDIGKGGKRYQLAQRAIKRWGFDRCMNAVKAGAACPYVDFGERVPTTRDRAAKKWDDVEHFLGDEVRMERCERAAERILSPPAPPVDLAAAREQRRADAWSHPVARVLPALHAVGLPVTPGRDADTWTARCPGHPDDQGVLLIHRDGFGRVHVACPECPTEHVLASLDLEPAALTDGAANDMDAMWFGGFVPRERPTAVAA